MCRTARSAFTEPLGAATATWREQCSSLYVLNYTWVDIDREPSATEVMLRLNGGYRTVPTVVFPDGRVLVEPSRAELEAALEEWPVEQTDLGRYEGNQ